MKEKILEILEDMEDMFETTGYYTETAGYGIKRYDYELLAEKIIELYNQNVSK